MAMDTSDQHQQQFQSSSFNHHQEHSSSHHRQSNGHKDNGQKDNGQKDSLSSLLRKSSSKKTGSKMCRSTSINGGPVIRYGLRHESSSMSDGTTVSKVSNNGCGSSNKSLIFVKLTDSSLKAIEEYIKVSAPVDI